MGMAEIGLAPVKRVESALGMASEVIGRPLITTYGRM